MITSPMLRFRVPILDLPPKRVYQNKTTYHLGGKYGVLNGMPTLTYPLNGRPNQLTHVTTLSPLPSTMKVESFTMESR